MELPQRVTAAFLAVLEYLVAAPHGGHGYRIARSIGHTPGTVSVVLRRLVAAGWATRRWDTTVAPARAVVQLTVSGLEWAQKTLVEHKPTPVDAPGS